MHLGILICYQLQNSLRCQFHINYQFVPFNSHNNYINTAIEQPARSLINAANIPEHFQNSSRDIILITQFSIRKHIDRQEVQEFYRRVIAVNRHPTTIPQIKSQFVSLCNGIFLRRARMAGSPEPTFRLDPLRTPFLSRTNVFVFPARLRSVVLLFFHLACYNYIERGRSTARYNYSRT